MNRPHPLVMAESTNEQFILDELKSVKLDRSLSSTAAIELIACHRALIQAKIKLKG